MLGHDNTRFNVERMETMTQDLPPPQPQTLPHLAANLISPVIAFYAAGCLISIGYFRGISPALLTAFSANELAIAGLARITESLATLSVFIALMALVSTTFAHRMSASRSQPIWDRFIGVLCILNAVVMIMGIFSMGLYSSLLGLFAILFIAAIGGALLLGWEDKLRATLKPSRYFWIPIVPLLGLLAVGEASFTLAISPASAQLISVPINGQTRQAFLLALGANAMVYQADHCFYISGPHGENPLRVNCPEQGKTFRK
jgi:hypothetical protein